MLRVGCRGSGPGAGAVRACALVVPVGSLAQVVDGLGSEHGPFLEPVLSPDEGSELAVVC